ncbi:hypothetical protein HID58_081923, partial [Brassica napus]
PRRDLHQSKEQLLQWGQRSRAQRDKHGEKKTKITIVRL